MAAQTNEPADDSTAILFGFSYNYDTYVWSDSVLFRRRLGERTSWGLNGGLSAIEISSSDGLTRKQRFVSGGMFIDHRFSSRWSGGISFAQRRQRLQELANRHFVFSDVLAKMKYALGPSSWLSQKTGFSVAGRSTAGASAEDAGFTSETAALFETRRLWNLLWRSHGSLRINKLDNTPSVEGRWGTSAAGAFAFGDTLSLVFGDLVRRTRYYPSLDDYETIAEQRLRDGHFLATAAGAWGANLRWGLITDFTWHRERYESVRSENQDAPKLRLGLRQSSRGYRFKLNGRLGSFGGLSAAYRYSESDEDFGANVKDQNSETAELELGGYFRLGAADSLAARTLWKIVSFFVPPDSAFYTDRDMVTRIAEVSWMHRFSPAWDATLAFSYRGFRQIFVSGAWSGNNNFNDIYLLEPRLRWCPAPGWEVLQTYRIQANYLSYDIEKGQPQPERSTLYRRGESVSRLGLAPLAHTRIDLRYTYRYEDFGPLIWREKWNQQISWDRRSHIAGFSWHYRPYPGWDLAPGFSFEQKRSYNHQDDGVETVRRPRSTFVRRVWKFAVTWRPARGRDDLWVSGSRRIQRSSSGPRDVSDWVELTYRRHW